MEANLDIVEKLNNNIISEDFNLTEFKDDLNSILKEPDIKFKFLDYEFCDYYALKVIKNAKERFLKKQNYEAAASIRDIEVEMLRNSAIIKDMSLSHSTFVFFEN